MEVQQEAIDLLSRNYEGVLATLDKGYPFTSSVAYFYDAGRIILLMSDLARHTKNVKQDASVSLMVVEKGEAPVYERKRLSAQGTIQLVNDSKRFEIYKKHYLAKFPSSVIFFTLNDFHFFEIEISELYFVGGFGKIHSFKP